jgi:hypothetical protein
MTLTFTWSVTGLKTKNGGQFQDAVVQTYWKVIGTNETGISGVFDGATPIDISNNKDGFVRFEDLTEDIVISWIKDLLSEDTYSRIESNIQKQIDSKLFPIVDRQLPWNTTDIKTT